jgi:hypothetical protein
MPPWSAWETIIRRDRMGRGVASFRSGDAWLGDGELERAAVALANSARRVAIVTGFCIADADPPAAETDGPPGTLFLARALLSLGFDVTLISDCYGVPLLRAGAELWKLLSPRCAIVEMPLEWHDQTALDSWVDVLLDSEMARGLTHVVAIERVGPSHTVESISAREGAAVLEEFERETPLEHRNEPHNMRGKLIGQFTAPAHRIFERIGERNLELTTIGIGDGGNEIGMGRFPWSVLRSAIGIGPGAHTACRIAADYTIVAGVSNWGAYALGLGLAVLLGRRELATEWVGEQQQQLIECLVRAGAVDGVVKERKVSVDGLAMPDYLKILEELRESACRCQRKRPAT